MTQVGIIEGKEKDIIIVDKVFYLYDTTGVPLSCIFGQLKSNDIMPSWLHFYDDAKKAGWAHKTIISQLHESLIDIYGKEFRDEVIKRLNKIKN